MAGKQPKPGKLKNRYQTDFYAQKARKENFAARSVYKLKEIQQKYGLIRKGDKVLDLGCAPGSWLEYAAQLTGSGGRLTGIDLKPVDRRLPGHVRVLTGDVLEMAEASADELEVRIGKGFQAVLSDMAPSTTGRKEVDAARSYRLCTAALKIAERVLAPGGHFVCKIFQGADFTDFAASVQGVFETSKMFKPQSSRKASREIYIIGMVRKKEEDTDVGS